MKTLVSLVAVALAVTVGIVTGNLIVAAALLVIGGLARTSLEAPSAQLRVTLSVNEILMDVLDAFKVSLPMINGTTGFATDFSSKTAVKGDTITAHISTLPTVQDYHATNGFNNSAADADSLLTDVPVTLSSFKHVPVKINWLTQLSSKMPLYKEAIRNYGYVLAKKVVDDALAQVLVANFSHKDTNPAANFTADYLETVRTNLNTQNAAPRGRFGIVNSSVAAALQSDTKIQSSLFYGQLNGAGGEGYRVFKNVAGFENIWEYPSLSANGENLNSFFADRRAIVIANRRVDFSNAAAELGITQVMNFYPITDPETGLEMTGVAWQQPGTGDVYVSAAILYGVAAGKQGGTADTATDKAGFRIRETGTT